MLLGFILFGDLYLQGIDEFFPEKQNVVSSRPIKSRQSNAV